MDVGETMTMRTDNRILLNRMAHRLGSCFERAFGSDQVTLFSFALELTQSCIQPGNWMWLACSAFFSQYCESM